MQRTHGAGQKRDRHTFRRAVALPLALMVWLSGAAVATSAHAAVSDAGSLPVSYPDPMAPPTSESVKIPMPATQASTDPAASPSPDPSPAPSGDPVEIVSLRTRDSKTFRNPDGSLEAMFGNDLHYQDGNGDWQDVDLNFRQDGTDWVMDRNAVVVRVTPAGIQATERASGKGIFWPTPALTVAGRKASFHGPLGLDWSYVTRRSGIKLVATVDAPLGHQTVSFPFQLLGGADPLSLNNGALENDVLSIPPPVAIGPDEQEYPLGQWQLDNGIAILNLDDTQIPASAFPYTLDPTTTFKVTASANDDTVRRHGTSWVPPCDYTYPSSSRINVSRAFDPAYGTYDLHNGFMRWDTSTLPSGVTILSATVRTYVTYVRNANGRKVTADWYASGWPPVSCTDSATTAQTSASAGMNMPSGNGDHDFALSNFSGVSTTGYAGLRFHVSGGTPTGINRVHWASYDATDYHEPYLIVKYDRAPNAPDTLSPASGNFTSTPQLQARYTDPDADAGSVYFEIKSGTTVVAHGWNNAPGGKIASGATAKYTPPSLPDGSYTWHAYANDGTFNSAWSTTASFTIANTLKTTKTVLPAQDVYARGQAITYQISVTNAGASTTTVTSVTDNIPTTLAPTGTLIRTFLGNTPSNPAENDPLCPSTGTGILTCTLSGNNFSTSSFSLGANETRSFTINAVALGIDRACSALTNVASATNGSSTSTGAASILSCDSGLGLERWWSYVSRPLGPQANAWVNVANGNLVVQQTDSTPVQARGHLAFVLRRSYNSQDTALLDLPGSIGRGWQLSVSEASDLGGAVEANGLYVPPLSSFGQPLAVTLIDRDGTRHVFTPKGLATFGTPIDVGSLACGLLCVAKPVEVRSSRKICLDQTYQAPPGVHLSLWRYVAINTTGLCTDMASANPVVIGFAAMRPDRVRYEFSASGKLLSVLDGNGVELRYTYEHEPIDGAEVGRLVKVYEPASTFCTDTGAASTTDATKCRAFTFAYPSSQQVDVTDPGGRTTVYHLDAAGHLASVDNDDAGSTHLSYTYGPTNCAGAGDDQLCTASDPRGNQTSFEYAAAPAGPARIDKIVDRRGVTTDLNYFDDTTPEYVTADVGQREQRFYDIDPTGRVKEIDEGFADDIAAGNATHRTVYTWDATGQTCTQPGAIVDNNLCELFRDSGTGSSTPDEDTLYLYNPEGALLRERKILNATTNLDSTYGYTAQYADSASATTLTQATDTVAGSGQVTSAPRPAFGLYYIIDRTQSLTPRGNQAGSGFASYLTTYTADNNPAFAPGSSGGSCGDPTHPAANTGNVCQIVAPKFNATTATTTRFTYDQFGQKATMSTPKAIAEGQNCNGITTTDAAGVSTRIGSSGCYAYVYYADGELDLSGNVSAGGWLKGVYDPAGKFVAFAYDRAGNIVRTWDRNATAGHDLAEFPGTPAGPPSNQYTETLYGTGSTALSKPWRYVRSARDQLGNLTTFVAVDENGNVGTIRPPRGNQASSAAFDLTQTFDAGDLLSTRHTPAEAAGKDTQYDYDEFGNLTATTDPEGNVVSYAYDSVERQVARSWTRGAWPGDGSEPPACRESTDGDDPIPPGRILCQQTTGYDGVDNVTAMSDGNAQRTDLTYDAVHREIKRLVPRSDGTFTTLRTDHVYDADGNVTDVCPPRQFDPTEGASSTCASSGVYSTHFVYDELNRVKQATGYRNASPVQTLTTQYGYDADGNLVSQTDPNGHPTTLTFDLLDRKVTQTKPRNATTSLTTTWNYDPSGDVTAVIQPGTSSTIDLTGANSRIIAYSYDAAHRVVDEVQGADNPDATMAGVPSTTGGTNIRTRRLYDADGNIVGLLTPRAFATSTVSPNASYMRRTEYDADGRPVSQYEPRYGADASVSDTLLSSTQSSQCSTATSNKPAAVSGVPNYPSSVGVCVTRFGYDGNGRMIKQTLPTSNGSDNRFLTLGYTDDGLVQTVNAPDPSNPGGRIDAQAYQYDAVGRVVKVTDALSHENAYSYTADGLLAQQTGEPNGAITHVTAYQYDANGDKTQVTEPEGSLDRWHYYSDGLVKEAFDGANDKTSYAYDPNGNPTAVTSPSANAGDANNTAGTSTASTFTWDNLLASTTVPVKPDGSALRKTSFGYDLGGRKTSQHSDEINAAGAVTKAGRTQSFTYLPSDRLRTETAADAQTLEKTYSYDAAGNLTRLSESDTTTNAVRSLITASYYLDDKARSVTDATDQALNEYSYDGSGNLAARADTPCATCTRAVTTYSFSQAGLPASMAGVVSGTTSWTFDAAGRPATRTNGNGQSLTYAFNPDDTLSSLTATTSGTSAQFSYTYDKNYRIASQGYSGPSIGGNAPDSHSYTYGYDAAGRVNSFNDGVTTTSIGWDHDSNRTSFGSKTFDYNADDSIRHESGMTADYGYDGNGRLVSDLCFTYTYDGFDRMTHAEDTGHPGCPTSSPSYSHDALDRVRTRPGYATGSADVYDGFSQTLVRSGAGSWYALDPFGNAVGLKTGSALNSVSEFMADDGRGNVSLITDSGKGALCSARYNPFGQAQSLPGGDETNCDVGASQGTSGPRTHNELWFRGAAKDSTTGTYQFGLRTYDPTKGSFLQPDSYRAQGQENDVSVGVDPLTRNTYSYVNGDPINLVDPSGHRPAQDDYAADPPTQERTITIQVGDESFTLPVLKAAEINAKFGGSPMCTIGYHGEITVWSEEHQGCGIWVMTRPGGIRQAIANFAGGALNAFTFGHAKNVLGLVSAADKVDYHSKAFKAGEVTGTVVMVAGAVVAAAPVLNELALRAYVGVTTRLAFAGVGSGLLAGAARLGLRLLGQSGMAATAAEADSAEATATRTFQTYTKVNATTGEVYAGRTSGFGTPLENVAARDASHAYNDLGFGPAQLDQSSWDYAAIRGREQQLIDYYRDLGISANKINGVSPLNPNLEWYVRSALEQFGGVK